MNENKKDIRQFETFEGRFMSIRIGISKSVLDSMTDEDRMALGSMVSCFEGDMFSLLKDYYAERISENYEETNLEKIIPENFNYDPKTFDEGCDKTVEPKSKNPKPV